ncbi:MAG: flagellar biosynthesis anti-sigma factor FlgM [Roseburia sp.]|nr:flagellar biosynthesis anti-sigma factor FlgM [Roseburia sp.]
MRIDAYSQIKQIYGSNKLKKADEKKNTTVKNGFRDQLMLSDAGRDAQIAKQAVQNAPDVRTELVSSLKERIDNGTYEVDTEDFAAKLLEKYNGLF